MGVVPLTVQEVGYLIAVWEFPGVISGHAALFVLSISVALLNFLFNSVSGISSRGSPSDGCQDLASAASNFMAEESSHYRADAGAS